MDSKHTAHLTPEQKSVLVDKGTEAPFTSQFLKNKDSGTYACAACGNVLFESKTKFDSNSGWPSFYDVAQSGSVKLDLDDSHGMIRTEVSCANCGGHLGHVFDDAYDQPGGKRYCVSGLSLDFKKTKD